MRRGVAVIGALFVLAGLRRWEPAVCRRTVHEGCYAGDFVIGDWPIGRTARFEDATWYPPGR